MIREQSLYTEISRVCVLYPRKPIVFVRVENIKFSGDGFGAIGYVGKKRGERR